MGSVAGEGALLPVMTRLLGLGSFGAHGHRHPAFSTGRTDRAGRPSSAGPPARRAQAGLRQALRERDLRPSPEGLPGLSGRTRNRMN
ncbi:hypothetical protein GCM10020254_85150 [Streptomyces goshikiensis]